MIRILALLLFLASPAAAQDGPCIDGAGWWTADQTAGFGPCESPGEGFFRISCATGSPHLRINSDFGIAAGQTAAATLTVDGQSWTLSGTGLMMPSTGVVGLDAAAIPPDAFDALKAGAQASLSMPTETRSFHLTGSHAALTAICR